MHNFKIGLNNLNIFLNQPVIYLGLMNNFKKKILIIFTFNDTGAGLKTQRFYQKKNSN